MNRTSVVRALVALVVALMLAAGQAFVRPAAADYTVTVVTAEDGTGVVTVVINSGRAITYRIDGGRWRYYTNSGRAPI